jgi:FkbM family methyltransferase
MLTNHITRVARKAARSLGYEVVRSAPHDAALGLGLTRWPIRTVLDVGANTGQFAAQALRAFPYAKVLSFEPVADAYTKLARWAFAEESRVLPINLALGDKSEQVEMWRHDEHSASSSLLKTTATCEALYPATVPQSKILVQVERLDDAIASYALEDELLLKLDVQGFEDRVLRGAPDTLQRARACILEVDLDTLYDGQARFPELVRLLDAAGLSFGGILEQVAGNDGHVVYADALFERR